MRLTSLFNIDANGEISFTPTESDIGNYTINIIVSDGELNDSTDFTFYIFNNTAPVILPIGNQNATENVLFEVYVDAYDPDNDTMVFTSDYARFSTEIIDSNTTRFYFTPNNDDSGSVVEVNITVTDSKGAYNIELFLLNISDTNNMPYFDNIQNYTIKINTTFILYLNATDLDNDNLFFSDNATEFNITKYDNNTALLNFTPANISVISVMIYVNDTELMNWSSFVINITHNHRPILALENKNVSEDEQLYYDINATDFDWQDTLIYYDNSNLFNISPTTGLINFTPTHVSNIFSVYLLIAQSC